MFLGILLMEQKFVSTFLCRIVLRDPFRTAYRDILLYIWMGDLLEDAESNKA